MHGTFLRLRAFVMASLMALALTALAIAPAAMEDLRSRSSSHVIAERARRARMSLA